MKIIVFNIQPVTVVSKSSHEKQKKNKKERCFKEMRTIKLRRGFFFLNKSIRI